MIDLTKDTFCLGGHEFQSRFILGSGKYSLELIKAAVENAGAQIITLALRRTNQDSSANISYRCEEKHSGAEISRITEGQNYTEYEMNIQYPDKDFPENYWMV